MIDSLEHHAYGIAGRAEELVPKLILKIKRVTGEPERGNPDFHVESYEVMGIDEARALKEAAGRRAVSGGKKIFIISARGITTEAKNALLKVFEEPAADTHFFLIVPSLKIVLETLRSRLFTISVSEDNNDKREASSRAETFLGAAIPTRLKMVQGLLKSAEVEAGKKESIIFLDEIERSLTSGDRRDSAPALEEVLRMKKYSRDRAPSFKLLLEHLALMLPKTM